MSPQLEIAYQRLNTLSEEALRMVPSVGIGLVVFLVFAFIASRTRRVVQAVNERKYHHNLVIVLGRITQWVILLVGLLLAITIAFPSFTPANLISALGITGIAIGFAFKDVLENFLAGILILVTEPFRINDQIVFGAFEGTVEQIETRATKLRTYDGRMVVIPNAELYKGSFIVNTAYEQRRLQYDVTIGNGDDVGLAKKLMLEAMLSVSEVSPTPVPDVLVMEFADAGVKLRIRWWIKPPRRADALDVQDKVLDAVKKTLTKNGIDLPYPTHQILFHDQTEETDGDRSRQREGWPAGTGEVPEKAGLAKVLREASKALGGQRGE